MSMIEPEGRTIGPDPVAYEEPVPEIVPTTEEAAPAVPADEEPEVFDRAYVEKLRDEAAKYRTRSRDYEDVFGNFDDETRAGFLNLARLVQEAPENPDIQQYLAEMLGFELIPDETEPTPAEAQPAALTREEVAEIARQEAEARAQVDAAERAQADAIRDVQSQAKALDYDVESPDYVLLLKFANDMDYPDLGKAHEQVQAYKQAQYEAFIAGKEAEARNSPQSPSGNGVAPHTPQVPKTWEEARNSLHERLSNL